MRTPFDTPTEAFTISEQGQALLKYHTGHRAAMFRMIGDEAQAARVLAATFDLDSHEAVDAMVRRMRHANADMRAWHEFTMAQVDAEVTRYNDAAKAELTPGMYDVGGNVYKVVKSKTDRLYAKLLDPETGTFDYDPGAVRRINVRDKMTLEQAKAYGQRTGICCVCGAKLTNPVSVAEGIGPICGDRF